LLQSRANFSKFIIIHQPTFFRTRSFYHREHRLLLLGRQWDSQLFRFDHDAIDPALFSQHDGSRRAYQLRGLRFNGLRNVKLAGHRPALPHKQILSHHRLPRLQLMAGRPPH
jgi:hypothetical protein